MANLRTPFLPRQIYHVYNHAVGEDVLFRENENYRYFLVKYREYLHAIVETFAYCLMPNHFHFLIRIRSEETILAFLQSKKLINPQGFENLEGLEILIPRHVALQFGHFANAYAKAYNKRYQRRGSLFEANVKRVLVKNHDYLTYLVWYIHNNPVHHGFVKDMRQWPYSSLHAFFTNKPTHLNQNTVLEWFECRENFMSVHFHGIDEKSQEKLMKFVRGME